MPDLSTLALLVFTDELRRLKLHCLAQGLFPERWIQIKLVALLPSIALFIFPTCSSLSSRMICDEPEYGPWIVSKYRLQYSYTVFSVKVIDVHYDGAGVSAYCM